MFIRYVFVPHLEDVFLDMGPDLIGLCSKEFTLNISTNSSTIRYEQTLGDELILDTRNPFRPVINTERVRGRFTIKGFADDGVTDEVNIASGPIDLINDIKLVTKIGLPPVVVSLAGIYTQRVNQFFLWRESSARLMWSRPNFLPTNAVSIRAYRLDNNQTINDSPIDSIISLNSQNAFGLEVSYDIGGNKSVRSGGNWFFNNTAQADEQFTLSLKLGVRSQFSRIVFVTIGQAYRDSLVPVRLNVKSNMSRVVYKVINLEYKDAHNSFRLVNKSQFSRAIFTDRII